MLRGLIEVFPQSLLGPEALIHALHVLALSLAAQPADRAAREIGGDGRLAGARARAGSGRGGCRRATLRAMRLDQWLWAVRVFKSRSLAVEAVKAGHVKVDGDGTKPAHEARPGAIVTARLGVFTRTLRILAAPPSRVAAKLVAQFSEELTPPEEFAKQRESRTFSAPGFRPKGAGRPTKRERRRLDESGAE